MDKGRRNKAGLTGLTGRGRTCLLAAILALGMPAGVASCAEDDPAPAHRQPEATAGNDDNLTSSRMEIRIGDQRFTVTLADNGTAEAFKALLPMTVTMNELNGNEKYHNLPTALPTDANRPGTINAGDLMLYGSDCVVLFYETFQSPYRYTRIGKVDNPETLARAVGKGDVEVTFGLAD